MESAPVLMHSSVPARRRGFTIIEMLVVLAIIAVITTIVVTGQSTYNKTLLLTDTSYTVALSARQAQSYGLGSRKYGNVQNPGYGLHFTNAQPGSYQIFSDTAKTLPIPYNCPIGVAGTPEEKPGDCRFDASDLVVNTYSFNRGFTVNKFCGIENGTRYCSTDAGPLTNIDMVFTRPNTTTTISGLTGNTLHVFSCAEITLTDQNAEAMRTVRVSSLGEISVNQTCS